MRLSEYTDYCLRVLMYCAARPDRQVTVGEVAEYHALSRHHLMKIVSDLGREGLLETTRGRGGGLRLRKDPAEIRVGDVVRSAETDFRLVECFDPDVNRCVLSPRCRLSGLLNAALRAYFRELDGGTLADLVAPVPAAKASSGDLSKRRTGPVPIAPPRSRRKVDRAKAKR